MSGFLQLLQLCFHIAHSHIPSWITHVFGMAHLLALTKPFNGIHSITVAKVVYQLTSRALCFQFHVAFVTHFFSHLFKVITMGGCEIIIHGIKCILNLHPQLGYFLSRCGKHFQFNVERGHISKNLCNKWKYHTTHPLCSCILCIWVSFVLQSA
jgi:hypothetical protein